MDQSVVENRCLKKKQQKKLDDVWRSRLECRLQREQSSDMSLVWIWHGIEGTGK